MSGSFRDRRTWTRSLTVATGVAAIATVAGFLVDAGSSTTERHYLRTMAGNVLFDHGGHRAGSALCVDCHHELWSAEQAMDCNDCHGEGYAADDFDHADVKELHGRDCSLCHVQSEESEAAASCRACHPGTQSSEVVTSSCDDCHDDGYTAEMFGHDDYMEFDGHACLGCHAPRSVSDAYHLSCSHCHLETRPERFSDTNGGVACAACHLQ